MPDDFSHEFQPADEGQQDLPLLRRDRRLHRFDRPALIGPQRKPEAERLAAQLLLGALDVLPGQLAQALRGIPALQGHRQVG